MADTLRSDEYRAIVRALRGVREQLGIPQGELSLKLGKPRNYINRIEAAERGLGMTELVAIAQALGLHPTELFDRITSGTHNKGSALP